MAGVAASSPTGFAAAPIYDHFRSRPDLQPPTVRVLTPARGTALGYLFIAPKRRALQAGPMIFDDRGRLVWFRPLNTRGVTDFRVQRYRGRPVLTWWQARPEGIRVGAASYHVIDSSYRTLAVLRPKNGAIADPHELLLTRRGTALMTTFRSVLIDGRRVADSGVQELDIRTGRVLLDWRSSRHVALAESYAKRPRKSDVPYDFFHVNSIDVDRDDNLIVSARNTHALYKLKRHGGQILWRLGGKRSDFALGRNVRFAWQHDARRRDDGTISLFDNGAAPKVHRQSRVLFLRLDPRRMRVRVARYVVHRPPRVAINQGNAQLLPRAHVLVGWGHEPYVTEFDARGRVLLDLEFGSGLDSYRAFRFGWHGYPRTRPAVAVRRGRLYVSWNGATEVRYWQVIAGATRPKMRPFRTVRERGFETVAPAPPRQLAVVRAVGARGRTLGWSRIVRTR